MSIPAEEPRDPFVPRPIDLPTAVPLEPGAELDGLDTAKILAAPDDPADWPAWREALKRWRSEAAARIAYDDGAYRAPELAWTQRCFSVALAWLWDELLYDHAAAHFTPERFCEESEREFGGFDGVVLWHAYPVIGIDERNQFDYYRDVPGIQELVAAFQARDIRVFVNYNPWDVGTRREPVADDVAIARARPRARRRRRLPRHDEGGAARPACRARSRCGQGSPSRANRLCRWRGCATTISPGRSGSATAPSRASSARAGSSSGTCSITRAAGTGSLSRSCTARG